MQPGALLLTTSLLLAACDAASEGEWQATVVNVGESGSPPAALADSYDVTVVVERLVTGGQDECALSAEIAGLGTAQAPGGASCDDQGFDGNMAGGGLALSVPEVESLRLGAQGSTMIMRVQGKSPDWERVYEGAATHAPPP